MTVSTQLHVMCIAGARPNFPKLKPILDALDRRGVRTTLVDTGQHYDPSMSGVFFDELGIRPPDHSLGTGSGTHAVQTARIMSTFEPVVEDERPDVVLVVGDVNSTVACGLVAAKMGCLVAHVEAGLRSRDWAMPEEINRVVTDRLADYLFAPSSDAVENLRAEGYRDDQIHLVGNVMIDSLLANLERAVERLPALLEQSRLRAGEYALATLHRPSNVDDPVQLRGLFESLQTISERIPVMFPAHPRTVVRLRAAGLGDHPGVRVIDPLGYLDFLALQSAAAVVLTDSGGVQEETTTLGVPCLTIRENTERPITISEGTNRLVGTDPAAVVRAVDDVLLNGVSARRPALWDGRAGERIGEVLVSGGTAATRARPTDLPHHVR